MGESGAPEPDASASPTDPRWASYCDDARKRPRYFTYCIDLQREELRIPRNQARLMSPDQLLQVVVRYADGPIRLEVRGQTGAYRPEVEQPMPSASGVKMAGAGLQSGRERLAIHTFSALLPGHVEIELTHKDTTHRYEVIIQKQLAGTLRVGVAFPTLEAVNRRYEAWTPPGSSSTEILEVGAAPVDVELVLGYKHFLRPVLEADAGVKAGVFFGMGILDGAEATLSLARSYYLGVDVGVPSFSLGVAAVIRQTDRLAGGLLPGDVITDAQDIRLDTAWRFGIALIICPAPELFRFSR